MTSRPPRAALARLSSTATEAIRREDWARAESTLRRLAKMADAPAEAPYNLALVLARRGKAEQSGHWLRKAVGMRQDYAAAWFELGRWELDQHDLAAARAAFARAAEFAPADLDAWRNLARIAERLGDFAAARDAWARIEPDPEARVGRMLALLELRDPAGEALRAELWTDAALRPLVLKALVRSSAGRLRICSGG